MNTYPWDRFFAALSDPTRLRLLNLMRDGEVCVCFFAAALGTNNPKISRHLAYLREAGLVQGRREGKWMHYSIRPPDDPRAKRILNELFAGFDGDEQMRSDRRALATCCVFQPNI